MNITAITLAWSIGQEIYEMIMAHLEKRVILQDFVDNIQRVNDLLESIQNGMKSVDVKIMAKVHEGLYSLWDEVKRIKSMGTTRYLFKRKECQDTLQRLFKRVELDLQLLNIRVEVSVQEHAVEIKRLVKKMLANNFRFQGDPEDVTIHQDNLYLLLSQVLDEQQRLLKYIEEKNFRQAAPALGNYVNVEPLPSPTPSARMDTHDDFRPTVSDACLPFIHFRHKCNGCGAFPIVGKRFQASGDQDFDFCEICYSNTDITCLTFEDTEVESDRRHQLAWRRQIPPSVPRIREKYYVLRCDICQELIVGKHFGAIHQPDSDFCERCHTLHHGASDNYFEC